MLPPWLAARRFAIEAQLPPIEIRPMEGSAP